jgi:hypothetical protein
VSKTFNPAVIFPVDCEVVVGSSKSIGSVSPSRASQAASPAPKDQLIVLDVAKGTQARQRRLDFERGHRTEPALLGQCTGGPIDQLDSGGARVI